VLNGATSPVTFAQQTIWPKLSDAAGQHFPLQQLTLGGQHTLVAAPPIVFSQTVGLVPEEQAP
jgi:hypothetical protein